MKYRTIFTILLSAIINLTYGQGENSINGFNFNPGLFANYETIALGEPCHGMKTINQERNNVTFQLIEKYDVKYIVWEEDFVTMKKINGEINKQNPNYSQAIKSITKFWRTEETVELLKFIHEHNIRQPDNQILILGMDLSSNLSLYQECMDFFTGIISDEGILERYGKYEKKFKKYKLLKKKDAGKLKTISDELLSEIEQNLPIYEEKYPGLEIQFMRIILENIKYSGSFSFSKQGLRDRAFFENIMAIKSTCENNEKTIVYAHNGHIAKKDEYTDTKPFGELMTEKTGDKYYALGFEFGEGEYMCYKNTASTFRVLFRGFVLKKNISRFFQKTTETLAFDPSSETLNYLRKTGGSTAFSDLNELPQNSELYKALNSPQPYHDIGSGCLGHGHVFDFINIWSNMFDGIYYVDRVEATLVLE